MTRMVITSAVGVVHDLSTRSGCEEMKSLCRELSRGGGRYNRVKALEVRTYGLPGCYECFGTDKAFKDYIGSTLQASDAR